MDIHQFQSMLRHMWEIATTKRIYMPILVWGEAGIGKTETVKALADDLNADYQKTYGEKPSWKEKVNVQTLMLGQLEVADLIGLPRDQEVYPDPYEAKELGGSSPLYTQPELVMKLADRYPDKFVDMGAGEIWAKAKKLIYDNWLHLVMMETAYALPKWFPTKWNRPRGILFLDEVNRGQKDTRQTIFQLLLERQMHGHVLPEDWIIVAAANPMDSSEDYDLADDFYDKALYNRFIHIALNPTSSEWMHWAEQQRKDQNTGDPVFEMMTRGGVESRRPVPNVPSTIRMLLSIESRLLGLTDTYVPNVLPTPRGWVKLGQVSEDLDVDLRWQVGLGVVGEDAAELWRNNWKTTWQPVNPKDILAGYVKDIEIRVLTDDDGDDILDARGQPKKYRAVTYSEEGLHLREIFLAREYTLLIETTDDVLKYLDERLARKTPLSDVEMRNLTQYMLDLQKIFPEYFKQIHEYLSEKMDKGKKIAMYEALVRSIDEVEQLETGLVHSTTP